jgi:hypothetical protein
MAQALFITRNDLVKYTAVNGNVDTDKFIQFIKVAQDIHIQNYLGSDLFNKISQDIINSNLTGDYLTLVETYVKPMVIHWAMVEYLPFASYSIANKGLFKHSAENASNVDKNEVDFLIEKSRNLAQYYTDRFISYMNNNQALFPEYYTNSNSDVYPDKNASFEGWVL